MIPLCFAPAMIALGLLSQSETVQSPEKLRQRVREVVEQSKPAALEALKQLQSLVTDENAKDLGFRNVAEAAKAILGKPLPVILMQLDELQKYKLGDDPYRLFHPLPVVLYAVNVDGETRSGVEVEQDERGDWEGSSFGLSQSAREMAAALKSQAAKDGGDHIFVLRIPALNRRFVGYQTDKEVRLIDADENAKEFTSRPASEVLTTLVDEAKMHDGGVR